VLHWAHRVGAVVVFILGATVALPLLRAGGRARRLGAIVATLLITQPAPGAAMVLAGFPLTLAVAHNASAALVLVALITAAWALHAGNRPWRGGQEARRN
jgi:cytochrome c oxidase assembly protein subunit 15